MDAETRAQSEKLFLETGIKLAHVKMQKKEIEAEEKSLQELLLLQQEALSIDPSALLAVNLQYCEKQNGYSEDIVPLLKQKGLRDCIKVKETADNQLVTEKVATGILTEEEVAEFKKAVSKFYTLPRGM